MMQEFVQELNNTVKHEMRNMHTAMPGKIIALDPSTMLATVQPVMKFKKPDGKTMDYPHMTGVPVVFPQGCGQGVSMVFPVKAGDGCLIIIAEQSLDFWMYEQETATDLAFDLTNAICIPGMFKTANPTMAAACASNSIILDANGTRVTVGSGKVQIDAASVVINGTVTVSGDVTASGKSLVSHTHQGDSGGSTSGPR